MTTYNLHDYIFFQYLETTNAITVAFNKSVKETNNKNNSNYGIGNSKQTIHAFVASSKIITLIQILMHDTESTHPNSILVNMEGQNAKG